MFGEISNFDFFSLSKRDVHLNILKNSGHYTIEDITFDFDYVVEKDYMQLLLNNYDLLSLIGNTELDTLKNVASWVFNMLTSSCEAVQPVKKTHEMICDVRNKIYGASCYTYACVLCEIYLSLGFKSRFVFCLPIDCYPVDCHVVTIVYSFLQNKWLLFDAAQDLYFSNENNEVLGLDELRYCLINDIDVQVNFLNGGKYNMDKRMLIIKKQQVLSYMAKNLYRFRSFRNSYEDRISTNKVVKLLDLVPCNYLTTPFEVVEYIYQRKTKHIHLYTSNSQCFWKCP